MPNEDKPTAGELAELWYEGRRRDRDLLLQDQTIDDAFFDRTTGPRPRSPSVDARYEEVHSREAFTYLSIVDGIFRDAPILSVRETGTTGKALRRAQGKENWLHNVDREIEVQQQEHVFRKVRLDVLKYARGAYKIHLAAHLWDDKPPAPFPGRSVDSLSEEEKEVLLAWEKEYDDYRSGARIPIAKQHVHPSNFHWWKDDYGMSNGMEMQRRQVRDLRAAYPEAAILRDYAPSSYVWWFEHQNRKWVTYGILPGTWQQVPATREKAPEHAAIQILRQWEHGYGQCSYIFVAGDESSSPDPKERYVPLLWPMLDIIKSRDRTVSQVATHVRTTAVFYGIRRIGVNSPRPEVDEKTGRPLAEALEPMAWNIEYEGEDHRAFMPPPLPPDTYRLIDWYGQMIQLHGLLPVLQGNVADYAAGYPINLRTHAARGRYHIIAENLQAAKVQEARLYLKMVEAHGEPISVFRGIEDGGGEYLKMTVEDARRPARIEAEWQLQLPTDKALLTRIAMMATRRPSPQEQPLMAKRQAREELLGDEDPERTQRLIDQEEMEALAMQGVHMRLLEVLKLKMDETETLGSPDGTGSVPGVPVGRTSGEPQAEFAPRGPEVGSTGGQATTPREGLPTGGV